MLQCAQWGQVCSTGALMFHMEASSSAAGLAGRGEIQATSPSPSRAGIQPRDLGASLGCADAAP